MKQRFYAKSDNRVNKNKTLRKKKKKVVRESKEKRVSEMKM